MHQERWYLVQLLSALCILSDLRYPVLLLHLAIR